jgi:hypothetical protein
MRREDGMEGDLQFECLNYIIRFNRVCIIRGEGYRIV